MIEKFINKYLLLPHSNKDEKIILEIPWGGIKQIKTLDGTITVACEGCECLVTDSKETYITNMIRLYANMGVVRAGYGEGWKDYII